MTYCLRVDDVLPLFPQIPKERVSNMKEHDD